MDTLDVEKQTFNDYELLNKKKKFRIRLAIFFTVVLLILGLACFGVYYVIYKHSRPSDNIIEPKPDTPFVDSEEIRPEPVIHNVVPSIDEQHKDDKEHSPDPELKRNEQEVVVVHDDNDLDKKEEELPVKDLKEKEREDDKLPPKEEKLLEEKEKEVPGPLPDIKKIDPVEPAPKGEEHEENDENAISENKGKVEKEKKKHVYDKITIDDFNKFIKEKSIKVVKLNYEECRLYKCPLLGSNSIYEWELNYIAEALEGSSGVDLEYEFETIKMHRDFLRKYFKVYRTKKAFMESYTNFRLNRKRIEDHNNKPDRLYNMTLTNFADTDGDMSALSNEQIPEDVLSTKMSKAGLNLGDQEIHVDWRKSGYVNDVINQGPCGSCWAIASADVFSSFMSIKNKKPMKFSYQQLVDCVSPKYNCQKGGSHRTGLQYIKENPMCTDKEYPYIFKKSSCTSYKCEQNSEVKEVVSLYNGNPLEHLKTKGPFLTLFYVSIEFLLYGDGIFDGSCGGKEAHSVVVVGHGYDKVKNVNYWIVKNSWGKAWGEKGYFRILDKSVDPSFDNNKYCSFIMHSFGLE
ncbi:Papain family cysteine protease family protein [Theileria parva strain Muguga]|uniref:Cysteine protease, putative n=1 Tax=Theileria parva TaxID=5875 RepID=Q4N639_THEPA|nr:Papain family cysteine protease family protein [Theileria parva strain Muguga]EAN32384.1 Papain family cysteine protease family protein [Theileria parva strain Muguga]|eukprot:XP_764667.1 cysteine protease [Theileria parva strain Muguga]